MYRCDKIHFKKLIKRWTDESLGDCSYLNTCRKPDLCKYIHYELDITEEQADKYRCILADAGLQVGDVTDRIRVNSLQIVKTGYRQLPTQWVFFLDIDYL